MRFSFLILLLTLYSGINKCLAQNKKEMQAVKVFSAPKIDGELNDSVWLNVPVANDFVQNQPDPGKPSQLKSEVKIVYDDVAIYVGAMLHEVSKDSILRELGRRDNEGNTDLFGLMLDTYNDDINAFGFFVTAAGVQIDARYSSEGQDFNWNAVWQSAVLLTDSGWMVEFKIPYSAIRFSKEPEQFWGVNFIRKIRRTRETSFWNQIDPKVSGLIIQSGDLTGINNITSPVRLSVTPYVSTYLENYKRNNIYSFNGGMDVKYGINESFTVDMTLVPDFGQVQSDNRVLNLSPFEVQYDENRQFFTEGTELFNKGGIFYSRRIGGVPLDYGSVYNELTEGDRVISNPATTQLYNAVKLSGRTKDNLGIGVFNATTAETFAVIADSNNVERKLVTQPLSNYNVTVFDQALRNNSYVSLINTNVLRNGSTYDANVTDLEYKLVNKNNEYAVSGWGALSQKHYSEPFYKLQGANNTGKNLMNDYGTSAGISFNKISGNFQFGINGNRIGDRYDPNDLGILFINNVYQSNINLSYNIYEPFWKVNNLYTNIGTGYSRIIEPSAFWNYSIYGNAITTFTKHFLTTGLFFNAEPIKTYDHFEARIPGRFYLFPENFNFGNWISSDYRKKFALDLSYNYRSFNEPNRHNFNYSIEPRYRASNKLSFSHEFNSMSRFNDVGAALDSIGLVLLNKRSVFGIRNVETRVNTLTSNYIFTNRMALSLRLRHYWSEAEYKNFKLLKNDGRLESSEYWGEHDISFNAFNVDIVFTWQFAPGSEINVVWKNAIAEYTYGLLVLDNNYFYNINDVINSPQTNSLSLKVLYFFDYQYLKARNTNDKS